MDEFIITKLHRRLLPLQEDQNLPEKISNKTNKDN